MKLRAGFTLIEMIIFVAIFAVTIGAFLSVFTDIAGVQVRQSSAAEVQTQSQFLLQTIQYYVGRSSLIEATADTVTTTVSLRMSSSTEDPVIIALSGTTVTLKIGAAAPEAITSNNVRVSSLEFVKRANPGGRDSVSVAFTMNYATNNATQAFSRSLRSAVTRVSAATFDSNVVPATGNVYQLGASAGDWRSINNTLFFSGSNVGIGISSPAKPLQVAGGDIYLSDSASGIILKNGSNCYRLTVTSGGGLATTSLACP